MDNQLVKSESLLFTLERQNQQGLVLAEVLKNIVKVESNVVGIEKRMIDRFEENEALYEKLSEQLTIDYDQQQEIKSVVSRVASNMTKLHESKDTHSYSANLFKAWKGRFISRVYAKLKTRMNVVRYTAIRKIDFEEAYNYIAELTYEDFSEKELEPTPSILNIIALELEA